MTRTRPYRTRAEDRPPLLTERDFQRQGSDRVDEKLAHSLIDVLSQNALAYQDDVVGAIALTYILWNELCGSYVVTDGHPAATDATHSQAL